MLIQNNLSDTIRDLTIRALWEVQNVIDCIPDDLWNKNYCNMPLWKHVYHMLHSLDRWYINPQDYREPDFHTEGLNNLDFISTDELSRNMINEYFDSIKGKIYEYDNSLTDSDLLVKPTDCNWNKFTLILSQYRHLHSHMGMIMGFIIEDTGKWPRVLGLTKDIPSGEYNKFF